MSGPDFAAFGKLFVSIAEAFADVAKAANNNIFGVVIASVVLLGAYLLYARGRGRRLEAPDAAADADVEHRPSAQIRVLSGPLKGKVVLFNESVLLGRDPNEAQLAFPSDPKVSRSHCAVRFEPSADRFRVKDLGSRNHTLLVKGNGARIMLLPFIERGAVPGDRLVLARRHEVVLELSR